MSFADSMLAAGLFPRDVIADGKWRRCPTRSKPKKKNGAYLLSIDGRRGWFKDFATDLEFNVWSDGKPVTEAQQRDYDAQLNAALAAERVRRGASIAAMRKEFAAMPMLGGLHPYLEAKGLTMNGCASVRRSGDLMVIPMGRNGSLMSYQTIARDGRKRFRAGCPVSGSNFGIVRRGYTVTCLVEGFATGLALHQSLPSSRVVVCFDAGNLVKVAESWAADGMTVVCADDDHENATNTGLIKGAQAAEILGCGLAAPEGITGTDWADALKEWSATDIDTPKARASARRSAEARITAQVMRHARMIRRSST